MEYVKGTINYKQQVYRIIFKIGKSGTYTKDLYQISIPQEENIFYDKENVIIMRENDFNYISNLINLETKIIDLKSTIKQLEEKIQTLEEYNRYLELEDKVHSEGHKSNFYSQ